MKAEKTDPIKTMESKSKRWGEEDKGRRPSRWRWKSSKDVQPEMDKDL